MARQLRRLLLRLRSRLQARFPGRAVRAGPPRLPVAGAPDPSRLVDAGDRQIARAAVDWLRQRGDSPPAPSSLPRRSGSSATAEQIRNVLFISHCDFTGNSAYHVHAIATELNERGLSPVMAIPGGAYSVEEVGTSAVPVLTYRQVRRGKLRFPDGRGPDLIHAFTPRERIRRLTLDVIEAHACRYVVHLEDNEDALLSAALGGADIEELRSLPSLLVDDVIQDWQSHPLLAPQFLERAAGATVVIDALLEFVPADVPAATIRAGFDESVLSPARPRDEVRAGLGLSPDDFAIVYPGHVHAANLDELRSLWHAVATLRGAGARAVLVKTGWTAAEVQGFPDLGDGLRDLGWVPRDRIAELLSAADALVQPGAPGPFNDFRLPSKLPEFLASGRPVALPRTNLGLLLEDGVQALVLERGDADEIAGALTTLVGDPELRRRLGEEGRAFALRELRWSACVDRVEDLYRTVSREARPPAPPWSIAAPDPPVRLIAIVDRSPTEGDVRSARAHGLHGFCVASGEDDVGGEIEQLPRVDSESTYVRLVEERLGADIDELPRFRSVGLPPSGSWDTYYEWLRGLTLQAMLLREAREPVLYVDVRSGIVSAWLERTQAALADGVRQAYASRGLQLEAGDAKRMFSLPR